MSLNTHQNFVARFSDIDNDTLLDIEKRLEEIEKRKKTASTHLTGVSGTSTTEEKTIIKPRFEDLDYW
jgi:hypothetical protein